MKNTAILTSGIGLIINGVFISTIIGYAGMLTILVGILILSYGIISGAQRKQSALFKIFLFPKQLLKFLEFHFQKRIT